MSDDKHNNNYPDPLEFYRRKEAQRRAEAKRQAQASEIEVELEYANKHLSVLVRDNGTGIDASVLQTGRDGHWGLAGMRERAESIGARLKVWSRAQAGTEVELVIPGNVAFVTKERKKSA